MSDKIKETLSNWLGYIIVAITCVLYVLTSVFVLNPSGKTLGQIVGDGILAFCMGISINYLLRVQGIINGMKSSQVGETMTLYGETVEKINPFIDKLGDWCHAKNAITYERQRTKILARAGLKYSDCFDENGTAKQYVPKKLESGQNKDSKEFRKEERFRKKCYWKAINLKLTELYSNDLTSEGGKKEDPNFLGPTIKFYIAEGGAKDIIARGVLGVVFGIYGIILIETFSWIALIWRAFQICTFLCFGMITMRTSFLFVTTEYRGRIIKKIDNLEEFYAAGNFDKNKTETSYESEIKGDIKDVVNV